MYIFQPFSVEKDSLFEKSSLSWYFLMHMKQFFMISLIQIDGLSTYYQSNSAGKHLKTWQ